MLYTGKNQCVNLFIETCNPVCLLPPQQEIRLIYLIKHLADFTNLINSRL